VNRRNPVFVVGSPRSGTTLLYHTLLSSGCFAVYRAETEIFSTIAFRFDFSGRKVSSGCWMSGFAAIYFSSPAWTPVSFREPHSWASATVAGIFSASLWKALPGSST
jgi:hypothetical protein